VNYTRFVFYGPNILLKLQVDPFYTLQNKPMFIIGPLGFSLPIHVPFGEVLPPKLILILS